MTEVKKVISVQVDGAQSVKGLKDEIKELRDALVNCEEGTQEYDDIVNQLIKSQTKLQQVMSAGKNEVEAAEGSYNALSQRMSALKKVWKEVTDEAQRTKIGEEINSINDQLKDMDASIGVFTRNVGDYEGAIVGAAQQIFSNLGTISPMLDGFGNTINALIPITQNACKAAVKGLTGVKRAIVATGIGALVVAIGLLIANFDKLIGVAERFIPSLRKVKDETAALKEENEKLIENNSKLSDEIDFQSRVMEAQGKTTLDVIKYKKRETEAILANTRAQILETEAKINSMKSHSAWYRFWHGENKAIKELEESLEGLRASEEGYAKAVKGFDEDIVVEGYKRQGKAAEEAAEKIKDAAEKVKEAYETQLNAYRAYASAAKSISDRLRDTFAEPETLTQKTYDDELEILKKGKEAEIALWDDKYKTVLEYNRKIYEERKKAAKGNTEELAEIEKAYQYQYTKDSETWLRKRQDITAEYNAASILLEKEYYQTLQKIWDEESRKRAEKDEVAFENKRRIEEEVAYYDMAKDTVLASLRGRMLAEKDYTRESESMYMQLLDHRISFIKKELENFKGSEEYKNRLLKEQEELMNEQLRKYESQGRELAQYPVNLYEVEKEYIEKTSESYNNLLLERIEKINKELEIFKLSEEYKTELIEEHAALRDEIERNQTETKIRLWELEQKKRDENFKHAESVAGSTASVIGSIASAWESSVQAQLDAGKISEEEANKHFEMIKGVQIAEATVQMLAAGLAAFNGIVASTGGWGLAAAIAQMVAVIATGTAQIIQIANTKVGDGVSASNAPTVSSAASVTPEDYSPQYSATVTGQNEIDNLANAVNSNPVRAYVVESDISNSQQKRKRREEEATF